MPLSPLIPMETQQPQRPVVYEGSFYMTEDNTVYFRPDASFKDVHSAFRTLEYRESHYGLIPQVASHSPHTLLGV